MAMAATASSGTLHSIAAAHRVRRATQTQARRTATTSGRSLSTQHFFRGMAREFGIEPLDRFRGEGGAIDQPRVAAELDVVYFAATDGEAHRERDAAARQHRDRRLHFP